MKDKKWFLVSSGKVLGETYPRFLYAVRAESGEQAVQWVNPEREFEDHEMESVIEKGSIKYIGATLNAVLFRYVQQFHRESYGTVDLTVDLEIITGEINSPNFINITVHGLPSSLPVAQITVSMPFEQAEAFVKESGFTPYSELGVNLSGIEYFYNYQTGILRWKQQSKLSKS